MGDLRARLIDDYEGDGRWANDMGDAIAFAPAYLAGRPDLTQAETLALEATLARERHMLAGLATASPTTHEEIGIGVFGLVASARAGNRSARTAARAALAGGNALAAAQRGYLRKPATSHGATVATLGLAYANLFLAPGLRGAARIVHTRTGEWLVGRVEARATEKPGGYFLVDPENHALSAEPNLFAVATLARAARLRRNSELLDRAVALEQTTREALFDGETGFYLTSEKAETEVELPIQNVAMLAYVELQRAAPKGNHAERGRALLANTVRRFNRKGIMAHTWSTEKGPGGWHCAGCGYQLLWIAARLDETTP